jgi:P63C domain
MQASDLLEMQAMENDPTGKAKGGFARAEVLAPERRKEIAQRAAEARWAKDMPYATHEGTIHIGEMEIACAVLNTGQRVVTQSGFMRALGRARQAKGRAYYNGDVNLPAFLTAKNLKPFISSMLEVSSSQIEFRLQKGAKAFGYADSLLPEVCDVFIKADRAGQLTRGQKHIADQAHIIMKGLARTGIAGLIDEATGYQEVRDKQALQALLDQFLRKELAAWAKRFPNEFYEQIFRLRGWKWRGRATNPPQVVAAYTKDIVYARLAPRVIDELERKNPSDGGRRKAKHHQWLTDDVGHPALAQHLHAVITLMRISTNWDQFKLFLDQAHPKRGDTLMLPLMIDISYPPQQASQTLPLFEQSRDH